jgi:transcriptional regulator with XRE-family HTH domain
MSNEALRSAMTSAMLTQRDLAEKCNVDVKTVARWIAQEGRIPHPRHRYAVAEALGADQEMLWPDGIRRNIKTGADREIAAVYPRRSDCPKSVWKSLITDATRGITLAGYTNYFLWLELPNLRAVLRRKAETGCTVRFIIGDPDSEVTRNREVLENVPLTVSTRIRITLDELAKLGTVPGIEARFSDEHIAMSVFMFDDQMLVAQHLAHLVGHDSPMLHIQRCQDGGLYDRYAYHVAELWKAGRPVTGLDSRQSPELGHPLLTALSNE